jgi:sugar/nucleoside kinase (ribokinase family)
MSRIDIQLKTALKSASVMGSGFIALDIVHGREGLFAAAGGSCGNVLMALAWLGWTSTPVARLGCDKAGDFVIEDLKSAGVNLDLLQRSATVPTPVVIQQFVEDAKGGRRHRFSLVCPECGAWLPRYRSVVLTHAHEVAQGKAPKAFYFDRTSPATVAMAEWAKKNGSVVLFEPSSIGGDSLFERAVDACDILKFSNERFSRDSELSQARGPLLVVRTMAQTDYRRDGRDAGAPLSRLSRPGSSIRREPGIGVVSRSCMCSLRKEHKGSAWCGRQTSNELCGWAKRLPR